MNDDEIQALAVALLPHLKGLLQEVHVHQYVLTSPPRRHFTTHETCTTWEFFCEHCLDVQHRTKRTNRAGEVTWSDY